MDFHYNIFLIKSYSFFRYVCLMNKVSWLPKID